MITYDFTKQLLDSLQNSKITKDNLLELTSNGFLDKDTVRNILKEYVKVK